MNINYGALSMLPNYGAVNRIMELHQLIMGDQNSAIEFHKSIYGAPKFLVKLGILKMIYRTLWLILDLHHSIIYFHNSIYEYQ